MSKHTPGPWPMTPTGDGKRIVIGEGLVEGPRGYEVAEVYSDDCDHEEAEANARLISAAPDLLEALKELDAVLGDTPMPDCGTMNRLITASSNARAAIAKAVQQ